MAGTPSEKKPHIHAIPCVPWRKNHSRKIGLGEDWQQRMIKMLPSVTWSVGQRNTVHQTSFVHTKKPRYPRGFFYLASHRNSKTSQKGKGNKVSHQNLHR